jgi:IclR family acetate operon transcriptional repressor
MPAHAAAAGKALLSLLPDVEVRRLVGAAPAAVTMRTIVDPEQLLVDLRATRRTGYAVARSEEAEGVTSVARVVRGEEAAVSVTGPSERIDSRLGDVVEAIVGAADSVAV